MKFVTDYKLENFILETRWQQLPDDVQQLIRKGKGFSTIEELEKWLEGADS